MDASKFTSEKENLIETCGDNLESLSKKIASSLLTFPGFMNMETVQAIEIEPYLDGPDRGCVVVCPDGHIYEFVLEMLSGPESVGGYQYSDNLREIDLTGIEKIVYFGRAIDLMLRHNDVSSRT